MVWVVNITERSGRDLSDYQVRVEINDPQFFQECTEQRFVEFYDSDKTTLLSHYTEIFDAVNNKAVFWVKVPSIPANSTKTIYLNVNTERAEDLSDPDAVFDFWDDFETLDNWRTVRIGGSGYVKAEDGYLKLYSTDKKTTVDTAITLSNCVVDAKVFVKNNADAFTIALTKGSYDSDGHAIDEYEAYWAGWSTEAERQRIYKRVGGSWTELGKTSDGLPENDKTYILSFVFYSKTLKMLNDYVEILSATDDTFAELKYLALAVWQGGEYWIDWVRVRKYTDPEPSVSVTKAGATATLDFKRIVAKALAGKISHILNGDPRIRLYSGGSLIKEITAGAKLRKEDTANKRYIVMFLFVDDSSDAYTTDSQELVFPHPDGDYVAFTQSESFEKVADEPLPLRWEIYVPWTADDFGWG